MNPGEAHDPRDRGLYANKGPVARALTIAGGPIANYLAASLLVFGLAMAGWRDEVPSSPMRVAVVEAASPAAAAGIRAGDTILEADGRPVHDARELGAVTSPRVGVPTTYLVERGGVTLPPVTIVPRDAQGRGVIGVVSTLEPRTRRLPLGDAARAAVAVPWTLTVRNLEGIGELVRHRSTAGLSGPVGMVKGVASEAEKGAYAYLAILVTLSVALGFMNLLPFPFLDGGRLLFLLAEILSGRRPNPRVEALVHALGLLLLLGMTAFVTWRDVAG